MMGSLIDIDTEGSLFKKNAFEADKESVASINY